MTEIVGSLKADHSVDPNGSFSINVPIDVPPSRLTPQITLSYSSAANSPSVVGKGWTCKAASLIERVPATKSQDGYRRMINYDAKDQFSLDGQRLINTTGNEYHFETEQWSKVVAEGNDRANPTSWTQYMSDGSVRKFGVTPDSNIKAVGLGKTRLWAISEQYDAFSNYVTYSYLTNDKKGSYYLSKIEYGGNRKLNMKHQREVRFDYGPRGDIRSQYVGGYKVLMDQRLSTITSSVQGKAAYQHVLTHSEDDLTRQSHLIRLALKDCQTGASVRPLVFTWVDGKRTVFDEPRKARVLNTDDRNVRIIPMDVNGTGRSDILVASSVTDGGNDMLKLAVHKADTNGDITPAADKEIITKLQYDEEMKLFPMDINGNGRTDLLHIVSSSASENYTLTAILSLENGFAVQESFDFNPGDVDANFEGYFRSGDFNGNGHIDLVYVYQREEGGHKQLCIVQLPFDWDKNRFTADKKDNVAGPLDVGLGDAQLVVGDLDGDGADDIFVIYSQTSGGLDMCQIDLFESENGKLVFRDSNPLAKASMQVPWEQSTTFLPYCADEDGKSSLLAISKTGNDTLSVQLLRSTGLCLLPPGEPTDTKINYSGDVTLARTTSASSVDLINTFMMPEGDGRRVDIHVLQFISAGDGSFEPIQGVRQPQTGADFVTWADVRGTGRADCLLGTWDSSNRLEIQTIPCTSTQPLGYITGYTNGLGACTSVTYAPLSDPDVYSTDRKSEISPLESETSPLSSTNTMARNISATATLATEAAPEVRGATPGRSQIVYLPSWVVKKFESRPYAAKPDLHDSIEYYYMNARLDFKGRGWLGFEKIFTKYEVVNTIEATEYFQKFPLVNQVKGVETRAASINRKIPLVNQIKAIQTRAASDDHKILQSNKYQWKSILVNSSEHRNTHHVYMESLQEKYHENGAESYTVDADYKYDNFGNITRIDIRSTTKDLPPTEPTNALTISSTFTNQTATHWVIGQKTREVVMQGTALLKDTKYDLLPSNLSVEKVQRWISGDKWTTQTFKFDDAGNEVAVNGPGPAERTFTYDATYTHVATSTTRSSATATLTEEATFDPVHGKPISTKDPNGKVTSLRYDVLGRVKEISKGAGGNLEVIEKRWFTFDSDKETKMPRYSQVSEVRTQTGSDPDGWSQTTSRIDGLGRVWRVETPKPDDPRVLIYSDIDFDGAGRTLRQSRDYIYIASSNPEPQFTTYEYDRQSRIVKETQPPISTSTSPIIITYSYEYAAGLAVCTQRRSAGGIDQTVKRQSRYMPNPSPSAGKMVTPFVVRSTNENEESITTDFDGLGRPVRITDPAQVKLTLSWDGLSRYVERRLSHPAGNLISHTTLDRDDDNCVVNFENVLAQSTTITKSDYLERPLSRETRVRNASTGIWTYSYDIGGTYTKERLASVTSKSQGIHHRFDYNIDGKLTQHDLTIDGQNLCTSYEWSDVSGALLCTTNPDRTQIRRTYYPDGKSVRDIKLVDANGDVQASTAFSKFEHAIARPLLCDFKNGIQASSTAEISGALRSTVLSKSGNEVYRQDWDYDAFSRISSHEVKFDGSSANNVFTYTAAGQLTKKRADSQSLDSPDDFTYDHCGNIASKQGQTFDNDGWQLKSVTNAQGATECSFTYSADGNMTRRSAGTNVSEMKYDAEGRLVNLEGTSFVYDFGGQLLKAVRANKTETIYTSDTYELDKLADSTKRHTSYIMHGHRHAAVEVAESSPVAKVYYFHADQLGSTMAVSDSSGAIVTRYGYDAFGQVSVLMGEDIARYKFSGKELFGDRDRYQVYYFGARFYDPEHGRFLTLDDYPIRLEGISPSTFNMYSFARNDPINFVELNGNVPWWHWVVDILLVTAAVATLFIPGGQGAGVAILVGVVTGAVMGAAAGAVVNDITDQINGTETSAKDYFTNIALGAAFGAATGGLAAAVSPTASLAWGTAASQGSKAVGKLALETTARIAYQAGLGTGMTALRQVTDNAIAGKPLGEGVGKAAWIGAVTSGVGLGTDKAFSKLEPLAKSIRGYKVVGDTVEDIIKTNKGFTLAAGTTNPVFSTLTEEGLKRV